MRRFLSILLIATAFLITEAGAPKWEEVNSPPATVLTEGIDSEGIDIDVKDGYIYITTQRAVNVKVFTILGQLITQENFQPGTYRFKMSARGIYILKVGSITRRITI